MNRTYPIACLSLLIGFGLVTAVQAATYTLANEASGNWSDPSTWGVGSGYPNDEGDVAQATHSNSTSGGNIVTRSTTLNASIRVGTLQTTSTGTWNVLASGNNTITMDVSGTGTAILGRTANNSNAGTFSVAPNILLANSLRITNSGGTSASTNEAVVIGGSISNAVGVNNANVEIRQGNNSGQAQGGYRIVLNGQLNNSGTVTISRLSSAASTGHIMLHGGVGSGVTTFTTSGDNLSRVVIGSTYVFDLGGTPDLISHNGGVLDIAGATISFSGAALAPSYVLINYAGGTGTLATASNEATAHTFGVAANIPTNYHLVHDLALSQVRLELIPEPASLALLAAGGLMMLPRRRAVRD
jgi:hypothetical protein